MIDILSQQFLLARVSYLAPLEVEVRVSTGYIMLVIKDELRILIGK